MLVNGVNKLKLKMHKAFIALFEETVARILVTAWSG
jgi:hypothetical protein